MLKNTDAAWGGVSRWFHWGFALAILIEVIAGIVMSRTFGTRDPGTKVWHDLASHIHHTGGILLLAAAVARVAWRLSGPVPADLATARPYERTAARAVHVLLYALLLLIPLSGWAALSALADSPEYDRTMLWLFGSNGFDIGLPRIAAPVRWDSTEFLRYSTFAKAHRWLLYAGAAILALHVAAALRHHFILRNDTLRRMLTARPR